MQGPQLLFHWITYLYAVQKSGLPFLLLLLLVSSLNLLSCKKDEFTSDSSAKLDFSTDTILFDTVFTTIGSATEVFIVYNKQDQPIRIASIRLAGGGNSNFRLNVDGAPGVSFTDVEIEANDSIFIFAEVTVDPNNQTTPLVVSDSIVFQTNGNTQDVKLVAWGQDAYFHYPAPNTGPAFFISCGDNWNNDKPHVIYGYALVDSGCTLTINPGTNVHLHPGSGVIVLSSGTINVNGTTTSPVTFQGDRLGEAFKDIPGQWDRIWLSNITRSNLVNGSNEIGPGTQNSVIRNAIIKNGTIGILADTTFAPGAVTLRLENTIIKNMSYNGVTFRGATVKSFNCVYANCGAQTANMLFGGTYDYYHCTFANYWTNGNRQDPAVSMNNYFDTYVRPLDAHFYNCIVHGNLETELGVDSNERGTPNQFRFLFDHALVKLENSYPISNTNFFSNVLKSTFSSNNPRFEDVDNNLYQLDSTSIAIDYGSASFLSAVPILNTDITGQFRPLGFNPDLGAYERR